MMPSEALPSAIRSLSSKQAFSIRADSWSHDVQVVLRELERHIDRRPRAAPPRSAPDATDRTHTADDFRAVALGFDSSDVTVRRATVDEIKEIAAQLELDEVLAFCRSRKRAERVGAAIALGVHIRASERTRADPRVLSALGELLNGRSSLVRYRAAEVLRYSPGLVPTYAGDLRRLAERDENAQVRDMAAEALERA